MPRLSRSAVTYMGEYLCICHGPVSWIRAFRVAPENHHGTPGLGGREQVQRHLFEGRSVCCRWGQRRQRPFRDVKTQVHKSFPWTPGLAHRWSWMRYGLSDACGFQGRGCKVLTQPVEPFLDGGGRAGVGEDIKPVNLQRIKDASCQ